MKLNNNELEIKKLVIQPSLDGGIQQIVDYLNDLAEKVEFIQLMLRQPLNDHEIEELFEDLSDHYDQDQ